MFARLTFPWIASAMAGLLLLFAGGSAEAQSAYKIRAGDTLQVEVLEDPSLNRSVLVLPDGSFSFPFVGSVRALGRTTEEIGSLLSAGLASKFANQPTVVVSVTSLAERARRGVVVAPTIDVYIMGEVKEAGKKEVSPGTTILQLLAEAGGLTPFAAQSRIELYRTDSHTGTTTVYLYSRNGRRKGSSISAGTVLAPGDVVVVPARRLFE